MSFYKFALLASLTLVAGCEDEPVYPTGEVLAAFIERECSPTFYTGDPVTINGTEEKGYIVRDHRMDKRPSVDPDTGLIAPSKAEFVCDNFEFYTVKVRHPVDSEYIKTAIVLSDGLSPREQRHGGTNCTTRPPQSCPID